jgi:hypothetical protein
VRCRKRKQENSPHDSTKKHVDEVKLNK